MREECAGRVCGKSVGGEVVGGGVPSHFNSGDLTQFAWVPQSRRSPSSNSDEQVKI